MIISEQTVTDANTGATLSFRQGVGIGVIDLSTREGRHSRLHFSPDGEIISIASNGWRELGVHPPVFDLEPDPDSQPPMPPKGLTLAEATE